MLTDEIIDEDIESLLYAQVYYATSEPETPLAGKVEAVRVNDKDIPPETLILQNLDKAEPHTIESTPVDSNHAPEEIINSSLPETPTPDLLPTNQPCMTFSDRTVQTDLESTPLLDATLLNVPQNSSPSENVPLISPQIQPPIGNITINQYIYPSDQFFDRLKDFRNIWSNQCKKDLKRVQKGTLNEREFFRILKRRLEHQKKKFKKQEQIRKAVFKRRQKLAAENSVICLSDSDNSDVEFVGIEMVSTANKKRNSQTVDIIENSGESDQDEIIYVEPPPVPVVNVDDDSDEEVEEQESDNEGGGSVSEKTENTSYQEPEEASNDFLMPTAGSDNFNFSLHGSEFQDSEFVRPANPHDTYDTESSTTSTSEFNRDSSKEFNNSVKTIVFNEIDFPKEDMFQENLEEFGNMITPTRVRNAENTQATEEEIGNPNASPDANRNEAESERSSSESDYEPPTIDRNLPDLCPMDVPEKKREHKKSVSSVQEEETSSLPKKKSKLKIDRLDSSTTKKKSKKKKKSASEKKDQLENTSEEAGCHQDTSLNEVSEPTSVAPQEFTQKKKNKKKKKLVYDELDRGDSETETTKKVVKKRKSKSLNATAEEITEPERSSKKAKKHKSKSNLNKDISEGEEGTALEYETQPFQEEDESVAKKKSESDQELHETKINDNNLEKVMEEDQDVVLIEQVIPVHTIDSSDSEDDSNTSDNCHLDINLANISANEKTSNPGDFDVEEILSKMSDDPDKWQILPSDQYNLSPRKQGIRCKKCRQYEHSTKFCPRKANLPSCALCGYKGHMEPRCPNKICFTCATPGNYSTVFCRKCAGRRNGVCQLCRMPGHVADSCPDLWRRYYLTTKTGDLVCAAKQSNEVIPRNKQWCSGCAGRGHLEYECNSYKWIREYPPTSPYVFSYNDVYKTEQPENTRQRKNIEVPNQNKEVSPNDKMVEETDTRPENEDSTATEMIASETLVNETLQTDNALQEFEKTTLNESGERISTPPQNMPLREPEVQSRRNRNLRTSSRKRRLNPLSVLNSRNTPSKFSSYQRMLNPCSLLGGPSQTIPSLLDTNLSYNIDTVRTAAYNSVQSTNTGYDNLYNRVPHNMLAQQILNLASTVATNYQSSSQGNFFQGSQYSSMTSQVSPAITFMSDEPGVDYTSFADPIPGERYHDYTSFRTNYSPNQNYLDLPYTITSERAPPETNNYNNQRYYQNHFEDHRDSFKSLTVCNVDDVTAKKFFDFSMSELKDFIEKEISKLDKMKNPEPKVYKKKLYSLEQLKRIEYKTKSINKQIYFYYKQINMFLFGIRQLAEGQRNLDFLRNFVVNGGRELQDQKRHALLEAYGYIFGGEHPNFNYRKFLNIVCKPLQFF